MPVRRPPALRRLLRREGHVPLPRPRARRRRPRLGARHRRQRAAQAGAGARRGSATAPAATSTSSTRPRALLERARRGPRRPGGRGRGRARRRAAARRDASSRCSASPPRRRDLRVGEDQRDPAQRRAAGRLPRAARASAARPTMRRGSARCSGTDDGLEIEFLEQVVGNRSPIDVAADGRDRATGSASTTRAPRRCRSCCPRFTDSRHVPRRVPGLRRLRLLPAAPPDALRDLAADPLADERIDVRDLGFAAAFFADLPRRLLR